MDPLSLGVTAVVAGAGAYFGSYLKKKGENLATKEDIGNLVEQVSAVTQATKEIEAKISDDVWTRQKHWEMKRDVVFGASKEIALITDTMPSLFLALRRDFEAQKTGDTSGRDRCVEVLNLYNQAANRLDQQAIIIGLVCGNETRQSVNRFSVYVRTLAQKFFDNQTNSYDTEAQELVRQTAITMAALRNEMGIPPG